MFYLWVVTLLLAKRRDNLSTNSLAPVKKNGLIFAIQALLGEKYGEKDVAISEPAAGKRQPAASSGPAWLTAPN